MGPETQLLVSGVLNFSPCAERDHLKLSPNFVNTNDEINNRCILTAPTHTTKSVTTGIIPNNGVRS